MTLQSRERARRVDAIDNERRVREAAPAVFSRLGSAMTMDDVAAEAGVSKGTVYATFGSRKQLIDEMSAHFLELAADRYIKALEAPSAWEALLAALLTPTLGLAATAGDALNDERPDDNVKKAFHRAEAALSALIEKGQREGSIRSDVSIKHLETLFRGLYLALPAYSPTFAEQAQEYGLIILRGIHT